MSGVQALPRETAVAEPIRFVPWTLFFVSLTLLSVLLPALAVARVADAGRSDAWLIALAIAIWAGFRLSLLLARGEPRLFTFFFWLFTYIFMGLAPAVQIRGDQPSRTMPGISAFGDATMMWTVLLGVAVFELGALVAFLVPARQDTGPAGATTTSPALRPRASLVLFVLGVLLSAYYLRSVGVAALFTSRDAASNARTVAFPDPAVKAVVAALAVYPMLVAVGALHALRRTTSSTGARAGYLLLILLGVVLLAIVVNPIGSARYTLGTVVFALAVLFGAVQTAVRTRLSMIAMVLGLFFVFPIADAFRRQEVSISRSGFFEEYLGNPDYDAVWQVANALSYWGSGLGEVGRQALGLVLFWVPRSIWVDKPTDTGILLANFKGYDFTNLSAPLWAEAVANGGLVALVLVFLVAGYAVQRMDRLVLRGLSTSGIWLVVGAIFPAYSLILLRGSLLQATGALVVMIASLVLVHRPQPRAAAAEA